MRQIAYEMKKLSPLLLLLFTCFGTNAQMLEQIDMSYPTSGNANTYVTGLNNSGYVTGYYNTGSGDIGFIVTDKGGVLEIGPSDLPAPATGVKVESINDYGVAVITSTNGGTVTIYRAIVDTVGDTIAGYIPVTGLTQPSSVAFDISNNNDISGWFQSANRYIWVKHDSIIPIGNIPFESDLFQTAGPTFYNTMGGGINDANKVAGFYIDGINYEPFVYNNLTEVFDLLAITEKTKLWDINNNGWVAGEYQYNGVWTAFIANASTGNFTQFTSLSDIFEVTTPAIQSVANAINDNGAVAGSYLHPVTGKWIGFVYYPEVTEYRIPDFNFSTDTWKLENTDGGSNPVWTNGYWQGTDYATTDPYANNGVALLDSNIMATHQLTTIQNDMNPKWTNFATEFDANQTGLDPDPGVQNTYKTIIKPKMFDVWYGFVQPGGFMGDCYGFTYTSLLRHFDDNLFSTWYGIPAGTNISQVTNSNYTAINGVERMLSKQLDPTNQQISAQNITTWGGLYRLKCTYRKSFNETDPRGFNFTEASWGNTWHSVLPYKIRTPRKLPFNNNKDTMFIYDSNQPDSTDFIAFENDEMFPNSTFVSSTNYTVSNFHFRDVGIRFIAQEQYSELNKSTSGQLNYQPATTIGLFRLSDYIIKHNGTTAAQNNNGTYTHDSVKLTPVYRLDVDQPPYMHTVDSADVFDITTTNYTDNAMVWIQTNGPRNMGISRPAQQTETDHSTEKTGLITYGNPDNNTKYLTAFMRENSQDLQQAVNITAKNICAEQGDSIVTKTPASYVYNITKVNGNSTCTYELDVYSAHDGDIVEFHSSVDIGPNTSHTIDPYYQGTNGTHIAVIVDNGLDGNADDTLFLPGFPLGVGQIIDKEGIKIYPNPVQDKLTIDFSKAGNYNVTLVDVVGRVVYSENVVHGAGKTTLPLSQLSTGVYVIQIKNDKGHVLVKDKIMKQ